MRSNDAIPVVLGALALACAALGCEDPGDGPECTETSAAACGDEAPHCLADEGICVECLEPGHCGEEGRCVDWACLPPLAPGFALPDVNPRSPSLGETIALSDYMGQVVLVYFAAFG